MRVIAGSARSLPLTSPKGEKTRPTSDRIKETLFNMISPYLAGCIFIDLFAGTGAIGIEALSRGALRAYFAETDTNAYQCLTHNIAFTKFSDSAVTFKQDACSALSRISESKVDIIFADPPYENNEGQRILQSLAKAKFVHADTLIIIESLRNSKLDYIENCGFELTRKKDYLNNCHLFMKRIRSAISGGV